MDSTLLSLLGAFLLSLAGLFGFIWSLRKGLLVENPRGASVIFVRGEIGELDDPAIASDAGAVRRGTVDPAELEARRAADSSSAFPVFMFVAFACMWLLVGSTAGLVSSIKG